MLGDIFKEMRLEGRSREQYEEAAGLCRAMVKGGQEIARAHALAGLALAGLGRLKAAVAAFDRSIRREPKSEAAHLGAAQALARRGAARTPLPRATGRSSLAGSF